MQRHFAIKPVSPGEDILSGHDYDHEVPVISIDPYEGGALGEDFFSVAVDRMSRGTDAALPLPAAIPVRNSRSLLRMSDALRLTQDARASLHLTKKAAHELIGMKTVRARMCLEHLIEFDKDFHRPSLGLKPLHPYQISKEPIEDAWCEHAKQIPWVSDIIERHTALLLNTGLTEWCRLDTIACLKPVLEHNPELFARQVYRQSQNLLSSHRFFGIDALLRSIAASEPPRRRIALTQYLDALDAWCEKPNQRLPSFAAVTAAYADRQTSHGAELTL